MNIYAKSGDAGETSIIEGKCLLKDDIRVASYGVIGDLIGRYLASDLEECSSSKALPDSHIRRLETEIDTISRELPLFKSFILPGGCRSASVAHVCRTICRRAERKIVAFLRTQGYLEDNAVLAYINRLSDYFFVLAQRLNVDEGVNELTW